MDDLYKFSKKGIRLKISKTKLIKKIPLRRAGRTTPEKAPLINSVERFAVLKGIRIRLGPMNPNAHIFSSGIEPIQ